MTQDLRALPKVMLHDHLDGGLRTSTLIELAQEINYKNLPTYDPEDLQNWILDNSRRGKLEFYLEAFDHTIAVMQTPEGIERVAFECGEDMASDGVVYLESRFAPELFTEGGLTLDEVVSAVEAGFEKASSKYSIQIRILCCGMKQLQSSQEIAELALRSQDKGVVGFDLAGPEEGFLCSDHLDAIKTARNGGLKITLHAGEGAGLDSIADAIDPSGAERLGHGVRIIDDINMEDAAAGDGGSEMKLGALAAKVRDDKIPLEVCPTSNIHTGIADAFENHPVKPLFESDFLVTLNTDNRLMSKITLTEEFANCQDGFGWGMDEFSRLTHNAVSAAFCSEEEKQDLLRTYITSAYTQT